MTESGIVTVPGEGPAHARIMLIGQNPGREEVKQGRPFVGRSGKYLTRVLDRFGIDRRQLYITPVVKEPTPNNRKPTAAEIARWTPALLEEIDRIGPRIIVLMGQVAHDIPRQEGIEYIETCHPAAAMRFPAMREKFEKDIAGLAEKISRYEYTT